MFDLYKETVLLNRIHEHREDGVSLWARIEGVRDSSVANFLRSFKKPFSLTPVGELSVKASAQSGSQRKAASSAHPTSHNKPAA